MLRSFNRLRELALVSATVAATSASASAESRCTARLRATRADGTSEWRDAVSAVNRRLAPAADCREIVVEVDENGADVTFTTRDARTATRRLKHPSELNALADALLVTVPLSAGGEFSPDPTSDAESESSPAKQAQKAAAPTLDAPTVTTAERVDPNPAPSREAAPGDVHTMSGPIIALGAGLTLSAASPGGMGQLEAGYLTRGWELGVVGRIEPDHDGPDSGVHTNLSASGVSALAARQSSLGAFTMIFGGLLGVYYASAEGPRPKVDGQLREIERFIDPRLGAMLGCLAPRTGPLRIRGQLDAQLGLLEHTPEHADLSTFPRFTVAFSLGAETGFLQ